MIFKERPGDFNPIDVVGCFMEFEGRFLLLLRQDTKPQGNTWGMPAGKVEKDEHFIVAMCRELEEETGYIGPQNALTFVDTVYVRFPEFDFNYHIYHLPLVKGHIVLFDHKAFKDYKWVTPDEALTMNLIEDADSCIRLVYQI